MADYKASLYRLPLGADILPQFVAELKGQEDAALVLGNGLLKEKVQFENITTFGLDTLAKNILNANGYTNFEFINRRTQELVIEELIEGLMDRGSFTYFKKLTDKKGFLKAVTKFLGQLSRTGLSEEKISEQFKLWQSNTNRSDAKLLKDTEVLTLYIAYRNYLKNKNWYDIQGMFRLVVWLLKQEGTKLPYKKLRVLGFYTLDSLQLEFFQELAKATDISIAMYYGEGPAYRACQDTYNSLLNFCKEKTFAEAQEENIGTRLSKNIFKNLSLPASSALSIHGITLNAFTSREKEMRYALTEIKKLLRKGEQAKDIAIVVRKLDDFTGLGNIADEYGLPLSLGKSCKLKVHPLFAFVKLLYASKFASHEGCENYFKLLSDPITNLLVSNKLRTLWKLKEGKFYDFLHRLQNDVADALGDEAEKLAFLNNFLCALPNKATIEAYAENLTNFVTGLELTKTLGDKYKTGEISLEALKSITAGEKILLDTIKLLLKDYKDCGLENTEVSYYRWLMILDEAAQTMDVRLAFGRSDGVSILEAASMQGLFYKNIFLLGLRRDEFPRIENENWIYNDAERRELHLDLPTTDASYNEDAYFFASTLAAAKENITISWHEEEKGERSPYVDNLLRIFLSQNSEGEYFSNLQINSIDDKELAGSLELWEKYPGCVDLDSAKDFVKEENILAAQNNRDVLEDEVHHGLLHDANLIAGVRKTAGDTFSASRLETYANCPYAYLLDSIWDLGDGKVMEEEGGPAEKGMLLHNTLSAFLNQHLHTKLDPSKKAETKAELLKFFAETWDDLIKQGKVNDGALWQAEKPRLKLLVEKWLEAEYAFQAEWFGFTPEATELGFYGKKYPMLKLELEDGTPIYLRGSIDRLDSNGEKIFITDYKMSKASVPTKGDLLKGSDLQMDVYLLAAKNIFKEKEIAGGGYFVLKGLERKPNLFFTDVQLPKTKLEQGFVCHEAFENTARSVITNIINNIYSGKFIPEDKNCKYCSYSDICRRREGLFKKEEEDA